MFGALFILAQALVEQAPASPPPEAGFDLARAKAGPTAPETITVTARDGEHPARLGKPLPEVAGPLLPMARVDLGHGVAAAAQVRTHPREGVGELHFVLTAPF